MDGIRTGIAYAAFLSSRLDATYRYCLSALPETVVANDVGKASQPAVKKTLCVRCGVTVVEHRPQLRGPALGQHHTRVNDQPDTTRPASHD